MIETNSKLPYVVGLLLALIISIGAGKFFVGQGENYSAVDTAPVAPPTTSPPEKISSSPEKNSPPSENIPPQSGALNAQDLSLGALTIDDPEEKVRRLLGSPLSTKVDDYGTRLKFDAVEVVLRNGKISALVSQSSAVSTPRGIHDGSPAQEIFDNYGTDYRSSTFEDTTLYEYTITSRGGTPCWLRFAVRDADRLVDYISVRFVQ